MQYGTTRKFLEIFGLRNLRELPSLDEIDQLLPDGIGIEEEDEKLSDVTESLSEDYQGNYSEGEEELTKIEDTLEGIDTSSEFFEEEKRRQKEKRDRDRARDIREALDVGEEVEAKDVKWLERYDKKLEEMQAEKEAAEQAKAEAAALESEQEAGESEADTPDELIPSGESLTGELSKLTTENLIDADTMARDEEMELKDEQSESEGSLAEENNLPLSEPESEPSEEATMQASGEELHPDNQIEISEPPADGEVEESVQAQVDSGSDDTFETFDPFSDSTEDDSEEEPSPAN
jgi:segregation and condensation protein B